MLGILPTDDQRIIAKATSTESRLSAKSGHGVGKTNLGASLGLWFLYTHYPSILLTTAPTERQVKEIMWREIRHRKANAIIPLIGRTLTMKIDIGPIHYALGLSTDDPQQMQGFHSPNIMIIIDEANGYNIEMYPAIEGILSGGERKILFQIGNAIEATGPFFDSFSQQGVFTHTISCLNHPNVLTGKNIIPGAVTKEWVDQQRKIWGEESAFWQGRVLGEFPKIGADVVINLIWAERAELLVMKSKPTSEDLWMGYDPAEYGGDDHVWYIGSTRGLVYIHSRKNIEPSEGAGITKKFKKDFSIPGNHITIDGTGAGAAVYSFLKLDIPDIRRFVAAETAFNDKEFEDKQTEAWWNLRDLLNPNADGYNNYSFCGKQDKLKSDLCTRKFGTSIHGRFQLEPKKIYRKRMKRSPGFADAMALCYSFMSSRVVYGLVSLGNLID